MDSLGKMVEVFAALPANRRKIARCLFAQPHASSAETVGDSPLLREHREVALLYGNLGPYFRPAPTGG